MSEKKIIGGPLTGRTIASLRATVEYCRANPGHKAAYCCTTLDAADTAMDRAIDMLKRGELHVTDFAKRKITLKNGAEIDFWPSELAGVEIIHDDPAKG